MSQTNELNERQAAAPADAIVSRQPNGIIIYGPAAFAGMRKAGQAAAECLDLLTDFVRPGVTTAAIDAVVGEFGEERGYLQAQKMYRGFRHNCCTSINHVVCHGQPDDKPLREGDIVNVDVTFIVDGWYGDSSRMYFVGEVPRKAQRLVEVTYESLMRGIEAVKPGATLGDIGAAIQEYAEGERCSVVRDFCGHGVGHTFHEAPSVLHYGRRGEGAVLRPGMIFTIEPMINLGRPDVKVLRDGWTAVTRDRSLSAQFEHDIGVTETGYEVFTLSPKGLHHPRFSTDA